MILTVAKFYAQKIKNLATARWGRYAIILTEQYDHYITKWLLTLGGVQQIYCFLNYIVGMDVYFELQLLCKNGVTIA